MNKHELVGMTIQHLINHFKSSPESFEYSPNQVSIVWHPKVQLGDYSSTVVQDPNNNHAVVIMFNNLNNELTCHIFLRVPTNLSNLCSGQNADCVISSKRAFEKWRGNYRKFSKLKDLIIERDRQRENLVYLKKLNSVFPDTLDTNLFDK